MQHTNLYYTLALLQVEAVGDILAKKLITHCGSAEAVFKSKKNTLAKIDSVEKQYPIDMTAERKRIQEGLLN